MDLLGLAHFQRLIRTYGQAKHFTTARLLPPRASRLDFTAWICRSWAWTVTRCSTHTCMHSNACGNAYTTHSPKVCLTLSVITNHGTSFKNYGRPCACSGVPWIMVQKCVGSKEVYISDEGDRIYFALQGSNTKSQKVSISLQVKAGHCGNRTR